jgi:hypothetical protein
MVIRFFYAMFAALSLLNCAACGQEPKTPTTNPTDAAEGNTLTIYSTADPAGFNPQQLAQQRALNPYYAWQYKLPGYGVVRQTRNIEMKAGENTVLFTDVATGIDPTTVSFKSLTDPDATVLEQNYEYDVVSADKLLQKYVGKQVSAAKKTPDPAGGNGGKATVAGVLLSFDATNLVLQTEPHGGVEILSRSDLSGVSLTEGGADLVTKPTLVWKIATTKGGQHAAQVKYQTDDLTWRADYNITINKDDSAADIGAWVSILNESGAAYPDAHIKLVAGDVQRVQPPQNQYGQALMARAAKAADASEAGFAEKAFFEYHLYTLGRTTSLANNSTKQIELFGPKNNVPVTKTFVYYGLPAEWRYYIAPSPNTDRNVGTQSNKKVDIYLQINNSEKNGLGIPLPAGRIRVYKRDEADQNAEFIGEDVIQHTPKDEKVLVKLGSAFDIVGERKQIDFIANYNGREITESFEIKIRNHKPEPVDVIIKENLFRWANWEITHCSEKWEKQDYRTIHIPVRVEPNGEKTVSYTVKYTW